MSHAVDVFWSFRSPYSYLVTADLLRLRDDFDVAVRLCPVLPLAMRAKEVVFDARDKKRPRYIVMDARRRANFLGLPFKWPNPDPVIQNPETFEVAAEQPLIWRLTSLGIEAERRGKGIDFAHHIAALLWGGTPDWEKGSHISAATSRAGLDMEDMEACLVDFDVAAEIDKNHKALESAGHWGVPTMVYENEPFFGQDRIDTLRWTLGKAGLQKVATPT